MLLYGKNLRQRFRCKELNNFKGIRTAGEREQRSRWQGCSTCSICMHGVVTLLTLVGIQLTLNSIEIQTGALSPEVPLHLLQVMLHELPLLWKLLPLKPLRSAGAVLHSAALPTSTLIRLSLHVCLSYSNRLPSALPISYRRCILHRMI